ncbi:RNA recognition motif family protein [Cryptosporidium muris RN66]|uniref:RNA recognition motif family protein n=1 Tax=Cryptosporidium muris (strain RN66) TaxID=441375 RepID=B6AGF7_CRYMR|nr:RNA recognition motif family protein [Cryptosporidium muris RN66]EEA07298.1 RNA recognition motif family protein [Cryptosporidium muris RN66]|eukprot:XP_002141647.1 RNA recognition motif family protein [Cryptosporidium muris RN66]
MGENIGLCDLKKTNLKIDVYTESIEINPTIADNHLRYIDYFKEDDKINEPESFMEQLFEGALYICGLHPTEGPVIWSAYREYQETIPDLDVRIKRIRNLFYRQLGLHLSGLPDLLDEYRLWEEDLPESYKVPLSLSKQYHYKGHTEWNIRRPYEMKVQTDNVSNLQELYDAWKSYIKFETDRMQSIEYSKDNSNITNKSKNTELSESLLFREYSFTSIDPVIMVYRRALDDLGSLRLDLWFEFANFIATTSNCPHLLLTVYLGALQHFQQHIKLWILYFRSIVDVTRDRLINSSVNTDSNSFAYKKRSVWSWYPIHSNFLQGEQIADYYISKICLQLKNSLEHVTNYQGLIELYTVAVDSVHNISLLQQNKNYDDIIRSLYFDCLAIIDKFDDNKNRNTNCSQNLKLDKSELFPVNAATVFFSQWIKFESEGSTDKCRNLVDICDKIINSYNGVLLHLCPSIFYSIKRKLDYNESKEILLPRYKKCIEKAAEPLKSVFINGYEKLDKIKISETEGMDSIENVNLKLPISTVSASLEGSAEYSLINEIGNDLNSQLKVSPPVSCITESPCAPSSSHINPTCNTANDKVDLVCLSEIRLRRDKRRTYRKVVESDFETSSECSSEYSLSGFLPSPTIKLPRYHTPPGTPVNSKNIVSLFPTSSVFPGSRSPSSASFRSLSMDNKDNSPISRGSRSSLIPADIEIRTQCTWDGREAIEPSIAPPIPPLPCLVSISSIPLISNEYLIAPIQRSSSLSSSSQSSSIPPIPLVQGGVQSTEYLNHDISHGEKMPPPSYTPKKHKNDSINLPDNLQLKVHKEDITETVSNSRSIQKVADIQRKTIYPDEGTLYIRPIKAPIDSEDAILNIIFDNFKSNIKEIRIIKDSNGNCKGYGYIDIEPKEMTLDILEKIKNSPNILKYGIEIYLSNPPIRRNEANKIKDKSKSGKSRYKTKKKSTLQSYDRVIFVKNIDKSINEDDLMKHFESLDLMINRLIICKDKDGKSKGYGFIEFSNASDALTAHMLNGTKLGSTSITVNNSKRPLTIPQNSMNKTPKIINRIEPRSRSKRKVEFKSNWIEQIQTNIKKVDEVDDLLNKESILNSNFGSSVQNSSGYSVEPITSNTDIKSNVMEIKNNYKYSDKPKSLSNDDFKKMFVENLVYK